MLEIRELATSIDKDGGRDLGALIGAVIGASLAYWALLSVVHPLGTIIVLTLTAGAFVGCAIGTVLGSRIGSWLAPKAGQTIQDADDEAAKNSHCGDKW